jgi:hypothetical protein
VGLDGGRTVGNWAGLVGDLEESSHSLPTFLHAARAAPGATGEERFGSGRTQAVAQVSGLQAFHHLLQ